MEINYKISVFYFKQTMILFAVSIFLFSLTTIYHLGVIGVIVFIRALFMLKTEYKGYKKYTITVKEDGYFITRNDEEIFLSGKNIISEEFEENSLLNYYKMIIKIKSEEGYISTFVFPYIQK